MGKYLFLDFNGTVLDDVDLCLNLLNEMLVDKGHKPLNLEEYKKVFTFPIIEYYKKAGFDFKTYTFEELADVFIVEYSRRNKTEAFIFKDFKYLIDSLKNMRYKIVLCSASKKVLLIEDVTQIKQIINLFSDENELEKGNVLSNLSYLDELEMYAEEIMVEAYFEDMPIYCVLGYLI